MLHIELGLCRADEAGSGYQCAPCLNVLPLRKRGSASRSTGGDTAECKKHDNHSHQHGPGCGHTAVQHEGHTDYLHDGHLHHVHGDHVDDHALAVNAGNPAACTPKHACGGHDQQHVHGAGCGHEAVPYGDHVDYLVNGHLHHPHGDHCDDHGPVKTA